MCILDLSKVLIYELHYDYIKNKYGNNSRLSTDNGTLMYEIQHDIQEDFSKNREMLDFSKYSAEQKCYEDLNRLVAGKIKNKTAGVSIKNLWD